MALNDAVPSSATDVFKRNAEDTDRLVNSSGSVTNRLGNQLLTWEQISQSHAAWNNRGAWATATAYAVNDIWEDGGVWYVVLSAYTSGASAAADIAGPNVIALQSKAENKFEGVSDATAAIIANPSLFPLNSAVSTSSYRTQSECTTLGINYPDGGGANYVVVAAGTGVAGTGSFIDAGTKQLKLNVRDNADLIGNSELLSALTEKSRYNKDFSKKPTLKDFDGVYDGDFWISNGEVYTATRVYAGSQASWVKDHREIMTLSSNLSKQIGCWWLKRVVNAYSGQCLNIENMDINTSFDVGFDSLGNLDIDYLSLKLGGADGRINTWYDQSGNGNNLTSTGTARPLITRDAVIGDSVGLVFESKVIFNGVDPAAQFMTIPATVATDSNSLTILSLSKFASTIRNSPVCTLNGAQHTAIGYREQGGVDSLVGYSNNSLRSFGNKQPAISPEFISMSSSAASVNLAVNGDSSTVSFPASSAVSLAGGQIGSTNSGLFNDGAGNPVNGGQIISGVTIFDVGMPNNFIRDYYKSIAVKFGLAPQVSGNLVFDGDSITEGAFQTQFNNWPKLTSDLLSSKFIPYNVARSGGTTTTQFNERLNWVDYIYDDRSNTNIIVIAVGTNDIGSGTNATTAFAKLKEYAESVTATGYDLIVCTVLPRSSFNGNSKETERLSYNQMIVDTYGSELGAMGVIDFASERTMGNPANTTNLTYYEDGTHITDYGAGLLASYAADYLSVLFS